MPCFILFSSWLYFSNASRTPLFPSLVYQQPKAMRGEGEKTKAKFGAHYFSRSHTIYIYITHTQM